MPAESLLGLNALAGNPRRDATLAQEGPILLRVISLIRMQLVGTLARPSSGKTLDRIDGVKSGPEHRGVVDVSGSQYDRERDALAVDHKMALRALFAAIRWIRPGFFAPPGEGTVEASMEARLQSMRSAWPSRSSRPWWGGPRHQTFASLEDDASRSCHCHSPALWGASPRGCRCGGRRGCLPRLHDRTREGDHLLALACPGVTKAPHAATEFRLQVLPYDVKG